MKAGTYLVDSAATVDVPPRARTEFWADLVNSYHSRMGYRFQRHEDFHGKAARFRTDSYQLIRWQSDAVTYHRTTKDVRCDEDVDYRLLVPEGGTILLKQHDQEAQLRPGMGGLMTLDQPFAFCQKPATQAFVMTIPRREVDHRLNRSAPLATKLNLTTGLGRVVRDLAVGLYQERTSLTWHQFDAISDRLVELLCMLLLGDDRPTAAGNLSDIEAAIRRYVREHAADPELNGHMVARALGWSLRQVQLALQQAGTSPRELIKEERLKLARERLQSPSYRSWTVTDLAHQLGFSSVSAFSTAFRERFGHCPRDIRSY